MFWPEADRINCFNRHYAEFAGRERQRVNAAFRYTKRNLLILRRPAEIALKPYSLDPETVLCNRSLHTARQNLKNTTNESHEQHAKEMKNITSRKTPLLPFFLQFTLL